MQATEAAGISRRRFLVSAGAAALVATATGQAAAAVINATTASRAGQPYLQAIRSRHKLRPLLPDPRLEAAARQQAANMARAGRMNHSTGWGKSFAARMKATGVRNAAENIAYGIVAPGDLFDRWMKSPGHRRNILNPAFSRFGLAYAGQGRNRYWALVLGQ